MMIMIIVALIVYLMFWLLTDNGILSYRKIVKETEDKIKIACVGDSITYGMMVKGWFKNAYPVKLQNMLGEAYTVTNFGMNAHTLQDSGDRPYRKAKVFKQSRDYRPDIVVFMLGTNDCKPENWISKQAVRNELENYLEEYTPAKIILMTPPDPLERQEKGETVTTFNIKKVNIRTIRDLYMEVAEEKKLQLIDLNAVMEGHDEYYASDGIHMNVLGAEEIAKQVAKAIGGQS